MEGPRAPAPDEYGGIVEFLNQQLRAGKSWSISDEYPTAFSQSNLPNIRIIKENDKILSHALWRPILVKTPLGVFKVATIGSVVTHSEHRNQGLSQKVISDCLEQARAQDCEFAVLWTNLYDFYRKLGFELAGAEISFNIQNELPSSPHNVKIIKGSQIDPEAILRVFSQHTVSSVRTFDEIRHYLQIPNANIYTAWDSFHQLKAYIVEGKGADLQGYVHEWGGAVPHLFSLINFARNDLNKDLTWIVPSHSQNLIRSLKEAGVQEHLGFLGMVKLLKPMGVFGKIQRYARAQYGIQDLILEQKLNRFYMGHSLANFSTDSEQDIVRLIFGPHKASQIHPQFDEKTKEILEKLLPISMWIWGWDSV